MKIFVKRTWLNIVFIIIGLGFGHSTIAQAIKELAVANCVEQEGNAGVFSGASYIIASNMTPGVEFICPLDAATLLPLDIQMARVYVNIGDPATSAVAALCFTDMLEMGFPSEICGDLALSSGTGPQALKVAPPKVEKLNESAAAFLKVWIPAPYGYSFFREFEIYADNS